MFGLFKKSSNSNQEEIANVIKNNAYLVDVRSKMEFSMGSVPGAVNIPVEDISKHIATLKKKENIVVFCRSGSRSGMAKNILNQNGLQNVYNGGTWQQVKQIKDAK
jgi:rhodanese-related sulfurtransferase